MESGAHENWLVLLMFYGQYPSMDWNVLSAVKRNNPLKVTQASSWVVWGVLLVLNTNF